MTITLPVHWNCLFVSSQRGVERVTRKRSISFNIFLVAADGLDSAGCSPKDDEDDSDDDDASKNCGAAALKPNKISPAGGYQTGSSYYSQFVKEKNRLARRDDMHRPAVASEDNPGCFEPAEDSFYGRYQRRQSDDDTAVENGFGANSDTARQRMMRRKQARQKRENAGLTTADSVAGYRGRDCSIEELIEYIDAKPPVVPKPGQKQTASHKNRKKKRGSNRAAKSDSGNAKSTTPVGSSHKCRGVNSDQTSPAKLAGKTAAPVDSSTGATNDPETRLSSPDGEVDAEMLTQLLLQSDAVSSMPTYEGSSSNASDADNVSDIRNDETFRNYHRSPDESVEMMSSGVGSERGYENYNLAVKVDTEPYVTVVQNTETVATADDRDHYKESNISNADEDTQRQGEVTTATTEDCIASVSLRVSEDSVNSSCVQCHYSEELCNATVYREIVCQPSNSVGFTQTIHSIDAGQSTPSSSISDARDTQDFDPQSLTDDVLSDFDSCSIEASHDSDFTVVTQKKKKNVTRQNASSASCLQRTFYNRNLRDTPSVRDWQSSCRQRTAKQISTARSSVPVTCSSASVSTELHVPVSQHTSTSGEVSEIVLSFPDDGQIGSDAGDVLPVTRVDSNKPNAICDDAAIHVSLCGEISSTFSQSAKDVKWLTSECKTREKVFLDTRQPNVGIAPTFTTSELSFYYDVNIPENWSAVQVCSLMLSPAYSEEASGVNAEPQLTSTYANSNNFPVATGSLSPVTFTGDANSVLCIDHCTEQAVGLQSGAGNNLSLTDNASQWQQSDVRCTTTPIDNISQTYEQPVTTQSSALAYDVTLPSYVSSSSRDLVSDTTQSGILVVRHSVSTAADQPSSSISATDSHQHSSSRSRQRFDLQAAQLFLYSGW